MTSRRNGSDGATPPVQKAVATKDHKDGPTTKKRKPNYKPSEVIVINEDTNQPLDLSLSLPRTTASLAAVTQQNSPNVKAAPKDTLNFKHNPPQISPYLGTTQQNSPSAKTTPQNYLNMKQTSPRTPVSPAPVTVQNTPSVKATPQDPVNLKQNQQNSPSVNASPHNSVNLKQPSPRRTAGSLALVTQQNSPSVKAYSQDTVNLKHTPQHTAHFGTSQKKATPQNSLNFKQTSPRRTAVSLALATQQKSPSVKVTPQDTVNLKHTQQHTPYFGPSQQKTTPQNSLNFKQTPQTPVSHVSATQQNSPSAKETSQDTVNLKHTPQHTAHFGTSPQNSQNVKATPPNSLNLKQPSPRTPVSLASGTQQNSPEDSLNLKQTSPRTPVSLASATQQNSPENSLNLKQPPPRTPVSLASGTQQSSPENSLNLKQTSPRRTPVSLASGTQQSSPENSLNLKQTSPRRTPVSLASATHQNSPSVKTSPQNNSQNSSYLVETTQQNSPCSEEPKKDLKSRQGTEQAAQYTHRSSLGFTGVLPPSLVSPEQIIMDMLQHMQQVSTLKGVSSTPPNHTTGHIPSPSARKYESSNARSPNQAVKRVSSEGHISELQRSWQGSCIGGDQEVSYPATPPSFSSTYTGKTGESPAKKAKLGSCTERGQQVNPPTPPSASFVLASLSSQFSTFAVPAAPGIDIILPYGKSMSSTTPTGQKGVPSATPMRQKGMSSATHTDQKGVPSATLTGQKGIPSSTLTQKGIPSATLTQKGVPSASPTAQKGIPSASPTAQKGTTSATPTRQEKPPSSSTDTVSRKPVASSSSAQQRHTVNPPATVYPIVPIRTSEPVSQPVAATSSQQDRSTSRTKPVRQQTSTKSPLDSDQMKSLVAKQLSVTGSSPLDSDQMKPPAAHPQSVRQQGLPKSQETSTGRQIQSPMLEPVPTVVKSKPGIRILTTSSSQPLANPERQPQSVQSTSTGQLVNQSPVVKHHSVESSKQLNVVNQQPHSNSTTVSLATQQVLVDKASVSKAVPSTQKSNLPVQDPISPRQAISESASPKSTHQLKSTDVSRPSVPTTTTVSGSQLNSLTQGTTPQLLSDKGVQQVNSQVTLTQSASQDSCTSSQQPVQQTVTKPPVASIQSVKSPESKAAQIRRRNSSAAPIRRQQQSSSSAMATSTSSRVPVQRTSKRPYQPTTMLGRLSRRLCTNPMKAWLRRAARSPFSSHTLPVRASLAESHALPKRDGQCMFPWKSHSASQQEASDITTRKASLEAVLLPQRSLVFDQQSGPTTQFSAQSAIPPLEVSSAQISLSTSAKTSLSSNTTKQPDVSSALISMSTSERHITTKQPEVSRAQTSLSTNTTQQPEVSSAQISMSTKESPNTTQQPESSDQNALSSNERPITTKQPEVSSAPTSLSTSERPNTNERPNTTQQPEVSSALVSMSTSERHITTKQPEVSSAQTSLSTNTTKQPEVSSAQTSLSTSERPNTTKQPEVSSAQTFLSTSKRPNTTIQPEVSSVQTFLSSNERHITSKQPEVSSALISMSSNDSPNTVKQPKVSSATNTTKQPEVSSALISMSTSECTNTTKQPEVASAQTSLPINERPNNTKQPEAMQETETTEKPSEAEKCKSMKLDEDQLTVLEKWNEKCLLINAGPGAGKTLVLCELIRKISEKRDARVLVLAFNRYAVAELKSRLETRYPDIPVVADDEKDRLFCSSHCGCLVSTFHSFAFQSSGKPYQFKDKMYGPEFEENVSILKAKPQDCLARRWDWVIVDEAQDVNKPRGDLIDVLRETCGHLMLAGDPRQSIDQESTWFANIWRGDCDNTRAVKTTLRYNHRSTRRIVEFLNQYSQHNFSDCGLHIDQQCLRETGVQTRLGEGILEPHDKEKHGDVIANYLLQAPNPDDAYAIVPVTFDKYNLDDISRDIESTIRSNGHTTKRIKSLEKVNASVIKTKGCKKKEKSPYLIGSVCSLKGTEKARVVVYGVSRSYNPKVKDDLLARRVYVAMSRAREHLHVITNPKLPNGNPLMKLINSRSAPDSSDSCWEYKLTVSDLAKEKCAFWPHRHSSSVYDGWDKPRDVQQPHLVSPGDERLLGEYMESVLAFCLGFKDADPDFSTPAENKVKLQYENDKATNPCLAVVRALRSKSERKLYTAGEHLLSGWSQHKRHCQPFASFIRGHMGGSCEYQKDLEVPIRPHRSSKQVGVLRGRADFAGDNEIVEVKYVDKLSEEHSLQAAIYCAMHAAQPGTGSKEALLINLKDGSIKTVNDVSPKHLQDLARAKLALMNARCTKDESSREGHHVAVAAIKTDIGQVVELGAVAFTLAGDVYGTYHRVLTGVSDVSSSDTLDGQRTQNNNSNDKQDSNLAQAGLRIDKPELLKNQEIECGLLRDNFDMWLNSIPDRQDFVYWDSSVCEDLGMKGSMVDLGERMAADSSSLSLEDCVDRNLGRDWVYEPHRAYENAVAVAALFVNHTFSRVRMDHLQRLYNCKRTVGQKRNARPTKKAQV